MIRAETAEVKLNYYALTVAILLPCTVETAFEKLESNHPELVVNRLTNEDDLDAMKLKKEGITWREIASYYNIPESTLFQRVRRWKRRNANPLRGGENDAANTGSEHLGIG